jgi:hypothetical protein
MAYKRLSKIVDAVEGALLIAACILLKPIFRPWYSKWGTTEAELTLAFPGDEYVPQPRGGYTQAISITASGEKVWPWLVQIGQDKGGFYSYELLENMVGCDIHNADQVIPEYQSIKVGDSIIMHPKAPVIPVVIVEPARALVYGGRQDEHTGNIWIFFLEREYQRTRLIVRWSLDYKPRLLNKIAYNWILEPIAAVMQRKMLLTIKRLAEKC